ncbi:MAG: hypothetical protein ABMA64_12680 [Myxococcota bacterium]
MLILTLGCPDPTPPPAPRACNGAPEACERPLDEVVLAVAHNAMNTEDAGWLLPNQHFGYERQVADGVRGFMLDLYDLDGEVTLCHADCGLGSEPWLDALARFDALLDAHPDDVFVFVIQDELDAGPVTAAFEASGLVDRLIVPPPPGEAWPPIGEWIDADTRLLVTHEQPRPGAPPWYPSTYDLAWDNDYASSTVDEFDCAVLRGDPGHPLFLLNHFLTRGVASDALAAEANPREVLLDHVERCEAETGDRVNWLAVDFYDVGDTVAVVRELNAR